jgi:hypothetical protein
MVDYAEHAAAGARLGIGSGVYQARDASVEDGSGAHRAGLQRAVERAVKQAIVDEGEAGGAERDDLGMRRGVAVAEDLVVASGDDFAGGRDDDGTDRDFAGAALASAMASRMNSSSWSRSGMGLSLVEVLARLRIERAEKGFERGDARCCEGARGFQTDLGGQRIERTLEAVADVGEAVEARVAV